MRIVRVGRFFVTLFSGWWWWRRWNWRSCSTTIYSNSHLVSEVLHHYRSMTPESWETRKLESSNRSLTRRARHSQLHRRSIARWSTRIVEMSARLIVNSICTIVICFRRTRRVIFFWFKFTHAWCTWGNSLKCSKPFEQSSKLYSSSVMILSIPISMRLSRILPSYR